MTDTLDTSSVPKAVLDRLVYRVHNFEITFEIYTIDNIFVVDCDSQQWSPEFLRDEKEALNRFHEMCSIMLEDLGPYALVEFYSGQSVKSSQPS